MSYDLYVKCSIWNFGSKSKLEFVDLLELNGYILGEDYRITYSFDIELINYKTVGEILLLMNVFRDKQCRIK